MNGIPRWLQPRWLQSRWLQRRAWLVGTGAAALLVGGITFAVIASVIDTDAPTVPTAAEARTESPAPPGGVDTDDGAAASDLGTGTASAEGADLLPATEGEAAVARATRPLPEFDESDLVFGGDGVEGAILGGPGIVPSTTVDRYTSWELIIPSARLHATIRRVGLTATGAFGAPDNPQVIGWWEDGPAPGQRGNVLLDGHRDFTDTDRNVGTGVCWLLPNTQVGDFILVRDHEAEVHHLYTVSVVVSIAWDEPEGVEYLWPSEDAILTLITCEGAFDEDDFNYSNRRILVAEFSDTIPFESS